MKQIGNLPLWVVLSIWFLQRMNKPRMVGVNITQAQVVLDDLLYSLPAMPRGRLWQWVNSQIITWVYFEKANLDTVGKLGLFAVGEVEKD